MGRAARATDGRKGTNRMGRWISFANQKGGVGKTTSAVNLAAILGQTGYRTLLVDLDPQGSATSGVGVAKKSLRFSVADLLIGGCRAEDAVLATGFDHLDLLPANMSLSAAEYDLLDGEEERHSRLRAALQPLRERYDFVLFDCPPSLGMLTVNALSAADCVVIPMQCEYYALEGLTQLSATIERIRKRYNPRLRVAGILVTMYNGRLSLSADVLAELKKHYGDRVFETQVSRNVRLTEAPGFGQPACYYDRNAKGVKQYKKVAEELLSRL